MAILSAYIFTEVFIISIRGRSDVNGRLNGMFTSACKCLCMNGLFELLVFPGLFTKLFGSVGDISLWVLQYIVSP